MAALLSPTVLAPLLRAHAPLMEQVLAATYDGRKVRQRLDILGMLAEANRITLAEILSDTLERDGLTDRFAAILRNRAPDLLPVSAGIEAVDANALRDRHVDLRALQAFAGRAYARRCRIGITSGPGQVPRICGTGVLVGRRLVLTAAHVVDAANKPAAGLGRPRLVVFDVNRKPHDAWTVYTAPVHAEERAGRPAPPEAWDTHTDLALLRLVEPIGRAHQYGHFALERATPSEPGTWRLYLLHYPEGQDISAESGAYQRQTARDMYLPHNAATAPGSSGGAAFCGAFRFLGHHQAGLRDHDTGRIVPFERYDRNPGFRAALSGDTQPDYLWSTDESPDGHFIIGRSRFFNGLSAIFEGTATALRGIWVRRMDPSQPPTGLAFGHDMLSAYLAAHDRDDHVHRIAGDLDDSGLLKTINAALIGPDAPLPDPETAQATERAELLAARLQAMVDETGTPVWLYFDHPAGGLRHATRLEIEHLVTSCLSKPGLFLVLAGFETFTLRDRLYETVARARLQTAPGLLVEEIGDFTREDVRQTVAAMADSLGLGWEDGVIRNAVTVALSGIDQIAGRYPAHAVQLVAKALRAQVRVLGVGRS